MGFTKTTVSFALAILATFLLTSAADPAANTFCDTADDKTLCVQMSNNAKTWDEAMKNTLNAALQKANAGKSIVDGIGSKLPANLQPQTKESIDKTCRQAYENVIDNIHKSMGVVKNDPASLKTYLSATSFSECTDGLTEFQVPSSEASDLDKEILKMSGTLLAVADKKP
ncbi:UNVERIFIED_CONTAM: hypothetical protein Sindi_1544500 [Sesamum indicum]